MLFHFPLKYGILYVNAPQQMAFGLDVEAACKFDLDGRQYDRKSSSIF
jgi:hypothetical protein